MDACAYMQSCWYTATCNSLIHRCVQVDLHTQIRIKQKVCLWCGGHENLWKSHWAKNEALSNMRAVTKSPGPQSSQVWVHSGYTIRSHWLMDSMAHLIDLVWLWQPWENCFPSKPLVLMLGVSWSLSLAEIMCLRSPLTYPLTLHFQNPTSQSSGKFHSFSKAKDHQGFLWHTYISDRPPWRGSLSPS